MSLNKRTSINWRSRLPATVDELSIPLLGVLAQTNDLADVVQIGSLQQEYLHTYIGHKGPSATFGQD